MSRYAIWNKKDTVYTPAGEALTPAQWVERYPIAGVAGVTVVCAGTELNGAYFGTLGQMVETYKAAGCDFSACVTAEEKLSAIEAFEDAQAKAAIEAQERAEAQIQEELETSARIAAALEFQNAIAE